MDTPSTKNYTIGKGAAFFDKKDPATGLFTGERDLGNAPSLAFNIAIEELAHYSSRSKLRAKDVKEVSEVTPKFTFTLDEVNGENFAMLFMGSAEAIVQAASTLNSVALTGVNEKRYYDLGKRKVGTTVLGYKNGTAAFNEGSIVSGATGSATISQVIGDVASGVLYLQDVTPGFIADETITDDGGTPGSADATAPESFLNTALSVSDTDTPATKYVVDTDYTVDTKTGRIFIVAGSAADGMNITVEFSSELANYTLIKGIKETAINGLFRYVSDNPRGAQMELVAWNVSLMPTGDTAMIGDDWSTMSVEAEILKDDENHPDSPYLDVKIDEAT